MDVEGDRKGQECLEPFCQFGMEMWYQNKCACILKDVTDSRVLRNKKKNYSFFLHGSLLLYSIICFTLIIFFTPLFWSVIRNTVFWNSGFFQSHSSNTIHGNSSYSKEKWDTLGFNKCLHPFLSPIIKVVLKGFVYKNNSQVLFWSQVRVHPKHGPKRAQLQISVKSLPCWDTEESVEKGNGQRMIAGLLKTS